ncbi:MAG: hypothetical protein IPK24_15215 [Kineosporiaceae bacterium]|nr:hypothetical protein [Kineosporiaceae bacterium]
MSNGMTERVFHASSEVPERGAWDPCGPGPGRIGPWGTFTRVYEVPGMMVGVSVRAPSAAATVGVYVWGRREIGEGLVLDPEARAVRDAG